MKFWITKSFELTRSYCSTPFIIMGNSFTAWISTNCPWYDATYIALKMENANLSKTMSKQSVRTQCNHSRKKDVLMYSHPGNSFNISNLSYQIWNMLHLPIFCLNFKCSSFHIPCQITSLGLAKKTFSSVLFEMDAITTTANSATYLSFQTCISQCSFRCSCMPVSGT
jgi:hypothetical protein